MKEALILIDIQNDYFPGGRFPLKGMKKAAKNTAGLLAEYRKNGWPIIHVQHISLKEGATFFLPDTKGMEINGLVKPLGNEKVFVKNYPNSFRETGLHEYLQSLGIRKIHLTGAMTNMCVDSTARAGFDLGYSVVIHKDCCAAPGFLGTNLIHYIFLKNLKAAFAQVN